MKSLTNTAANKTTKPIASILMFVGGLFTLSTCSALFDSANTDKFSLLAGMIIFGVVPLLGGFFLFKNAKKTEKRANVEFLERTVLNLVQKSNGVVSPLQLAQTTLLTSDEAQKLLDEFVIKGIATVEVNDLGEIEYHFPTYLKS